MSTEQQTPDNTEPTPQTEAPQQAEAPAQQEPVQLAYPEPQADEAAKEEGPRKATTEFLDKLTEQPAKEAAKPAAQEAPKADKPPQEAPKPKEEGEGDLLEAVNTDRGKERVRKVFEENKALKQEMVGVREMLGRYDLPPTELAQLMEFGRLTRSANPQDARLALEMLDQQRLALAQRLGVSLPGVDLLKEFPDLQQGVQDLRIEPALAHEIARLRMQERTQQQAQQRQAQHSQQQVYFQQQAQQAQSQMETYLQSRAHEVDHPARMQALTEHFSDPAKLQAFVQTYAPEQWLPTLQVMYDSIRAPQPRAAAPQPLRSRPSTIGTPVQGGETAIDRLNAAISGMGIG